MRSDWRALHAHLLREAARLPFQKDFETIRARREDLHPFRDPAALLDALQRPSGDPEAKNAVLRAVVVEAQGEGRRARAAVTLLHLALWPGLDAVYRRLLRHFRSEPGALAAEISGRLVEGVAGLGLDRVNRIAATLIRNIERDLRRLLEKRWREAARTVALFETDLAPDEPLPSRFGVPAGTDADRAAGLIAARLEGVIGEDAGLVADIALRGVSQQEASTARGLSYEAGRKRYQRALAKMRARLAE